MKATKLPSGSWRAQAYDKNTKKRRSFTADTKKERPNIYIPTEEEVKKLISTAGGTDMEIPVLLAAFCTMRRGEISALQAEDIINGTIHVKASLADAGGGVWIRKAPKSYAGNRYITCPAFILDLLPKHGPVTPLNPDSITHGMERLVRRSGVHDMHFHCLRHYCASQMIAHGIPISDVKKIGGWDSQALEQIYMHSLEESRKKSDAIWLKFSDGFLNDCTRTAHENSENGLK